jgi:phosphoheptose isomerase
MIITCITTNPAQTRILKIVKAAWKCGLDLQGITLPMTSGEIQSIIKNELRVESNRTANQASELNA